MHDTTSHEATELYLFAKNTREVYDRCVLPRYRWIERRVLAGHDDKNDFINAIVSYTLRRAADAYCREHCDRSQRPWDLFNKNCRLEVAELMVDEVLAELQIGNSYLP